MHGPESKVRRLSVHARTSSGKDKAFTLTQLDLSHARSVTLFADSVEAVPLWSEFSFLRVLDLQGCRQVEGRHLTNIGSLFQLKFLSLRETEVSDLPEHIWKVKVLEALDLKKLKVTNLPPGIFLSSED